MQTNELGLPCWKGGGGSRINKVQSCYKDFLNKIFRISIIFQILINLTFLIFKDILRTAVPKIKGHKTVILWLNGQTEFKLVYWPVDVGFLYTEVVTVWEQLAVCLWIKMSKNGNSPLFSLSIVNLIGLPIELEVKRMSNKSASFEIRKTSYNVSKKVYVCQGKQ